MWPTHPEESSILAFFSHQASSIDLGRNRPALMQTLPAPSVGRSAISLISASK
jgi:hypothetical protein